MKVLQIVAAALMGFVFVYLIFAFYWFSVDPAVWGQDSRLVYVLLSTWVACALGAIAGAAQ